MNQEIRNVFSELKVAGQRSAMSIGDKREKDLKLISYLKAFIEENTDAHFEDIGFCYWNISDNYAFLRDGHSLCENHKRFYDHIINQNSYYLFWLVCDATQRLALEKDGHGTFWWNLYREAIEQNTNNKQYFAEFNIHRAALYSNKNLTISQDNLNYAKSNYEKFLSKTESTSENLFYKMIYLSLVSKFSLVDDNELYCSGNLLFEYLSFPKISKDFLTGEWKSFVTPFDKKKQAEVGIISAVNALIHCNNTKKARDLYFEACRMGLPQNHYIETRLHEF